MLLAALRALTAGIVGEPRQKQASARLHGLNDRSSVHRSHKHFKREKQTQTEWRGGARESTWLETNTSSHSKSKTYDKTQHNTSHEQYTHNITAQTNHHLAETGVGELFIFMITQSSRDQLDPFYLRPSFIINWPYYNWPYFNFQLFRYGLVWYTAAHRSLLSASASI